MIFNIDQLSKTEYDDSDLDDYEDDLIELFAESPEGKAFLAAYPKEDIGFWAAQLIHYGYTYEGYTIPSMTAWEVEDVVINLFPRKISLAQPEHADIAMPELIAFWEFLKREFKLRRADSILKFLRKTGSNYRDIMMDSSKFGMAKSFITAGQAAGYDMTDEKQLNQFMNEYNAQVLSQNSDDAPPLSVGSGMPSLFSPPPQGTKKRSASQVKKKKRRKLAKASKRKNRKKRK
ncbi:hypothetical protein QUF63_15455 [Anaerolineales bacterium HSG25]|nr:hypothetical protein [Anaerolineales bacterium HSG25]